MINKSTLTVIAALAAVAVTSPVLAQSFDPDMGTGNIVGINSGPTAPQSREASGLQAYAMAPRTSAASSTGASSGYEELLKEQW